MLKLNKKVTLGKISSCFKKISRKYKKSNNDIINKYFSRFLLLYVCIISSNKHFLITYNVFGDTRANIYVSINAKFITFIKKQL